MLSIFTLSHISGTLLSCTISTLSLPNRTPCSPPSWPPFCCGAFWESDSCRPITYQHSSLVPGFLPACPPVSLTTPQFTPVAACDRTPSSKSEWSHSCTPTHLKTCGCFCPRLVWTAPLSPREGRSLLSVLFDRRPETVSESCFTSLFFPRSWSFTLSDQQLPPRTSVGGDWWTRCTCLIFQYFPKHVLLWWSAFPSFFTNAHWF